LDNKGLAPASFSHLFYDNDKDMHLLRNLPRIDPEEGSHYSHRSFLDWHVAGEILEIGELE